MLVLDIPRLFNGRILDVPYYHLPHLGLIDVDNVSICFIPNQIGSDGNLQPDTLPELLISAIDFSRWENIWCLTCFLKDRTGLLHDIYDVLASNYGINVFCAESSGIENENMHYSEMLIDIDTSPGSLCEFVEHIMWSLKVRLFDDIVYNAQGTPLITLRPVHTLHRAKQLYDQANRSLVFGDRIAVNASAKIEIFSRKLRNKKHGHSATCTTQSTEPEIKLPDITRRIILPTTIREALRKELGQLNKSFALRLSDTQRFPETQFFYNYQ